MSAALARVALAAALALAAAPWAPASSAAAASAAASSFAANDLRRAGLVRIGDVLRLAEAWDVTTIEGFTWDARPPGVVDGASAGFAVFVDGISVDLDLLGTTSLNRLPFGLERIERVAFDDRPIVVRGRLAPGGAVHITTRRPGAAVSLRARHVSGSETGDPGPNQFTERATPNVERFGFESSATLSVSRGGAPPERPPPAAHVPPASRFWSDVAFVRARHYASDEAILPRWVAIGGSDFRVIEKEAPSWRAGWDGARGTVAVHAGASTIDEGFFLRALGREIPVESTFREIGARGAWHARPGGGFTLEASARSTTNELDATERRGAPRLDWRRTAQGGDAAAIVRRGARTVSLGARVDSYEVASRDRTIRAQTWASSGVFARFAEDDGASGTSRAIDLSAGRSRGRAVYAFAFTRVRAGVDASVLAARRGPEESAPFSFWRERGLDVLDEAGIPNTTRGTLRGASLLSGDLGVTFGSGAPRLGAPESEGQFSVRLGVFTRRFADLALDDARFVSDSLGVPGAAELALHFEEEGTAAGGSVRATLRLAPFAHLRISWRGQDAVDGTALFRAAARSTPKHLARIALFGSPLIGLEVEVAVRSRSAARWSAYEFGPEAIDAGASLDAARADASLPPTAAVDLSFSKSFARRRLHLGLVFRDLFDRPVRTHPIGEIERLTVVVQAELALGGT